MSTPQVLVVEDEKIVATDIRENLKTLGYSVPAVISSGEEAISFASESRPDLVLMDIQLKGRVDGIEAAKIVQGRLNIPVVFITAFADDPTLQRAKATDPFGYILKPFGKKELQTSIEIALHKHQRERRTRTNEEWLMSLVKSMDEGLIAVDKTGSVCLMNPAAEEITGGSLEDTLGALWSDVLEFTNRRSSENPFSRALETNTTVHLPDCPVRFKRTERHATLTASVCPLLAGGSGPTGAIFCFREHTAQQLTERQFQQARHLESLQRLAGGIAHNLNNVLTVISGYSESLLSQFPPNAPGYRDVRMIQQANDRACGLSQQLLAFSRRHSVHAKLIHLNEILRNSESMIRQIVGPSIEVSYALDPDLGAA